MKMVEQFNSSLMHQYRAIEQQVSGKVQIQKGRMFTDSWRAVRISRRFIPEIGRTRDSQLLL